MVRSFAAFASVAVAATLLSVADAHSNMVAPAPRWPEGFYNGNSPVGTVDSTKFTGGGAGMAGHQGVAKLKAELAGGDLRSFISSRIAMDGAMKGATKDCGMSQLTGTPYPLPAEVDFPWGHPGACAAYCDDVQFFKDDDCQGNGVGKIKVDQAKCANAKRLQVMYLGVHVTDYQYYVNCVPLGGSGAAGGGAAPAPAPAGGNGSGSAPAATPKPAPAPAPASPSAPAATPKPAPAPAPATPTVTKKNCVRRLRK